MCLCTLAHLSCLLAILVRVLMNFCPFCGATIDTTMTTEQGGGPEYFVDSVLRSLCVKNATPLCKGPRLETANVETATGAPSNEYTPLTYVAYPKNAHRSTCVASLDGSSTATSFFSLLLASLPDIQCVKGYNQQDLETGLHGVQREATSYLSVTLRPPSTALHVFSVMYSYIPFVVFGFCSLWAVVSWQFLPVYATILQCFGCIVNECYLKNLIREPRPYLSQVKSHGMPSSHCLVSYALLSWILLETTFNLQAALTWKAVACSEWLLLLAPVPWARMYVCDHSEKQCLMGCILGILCGIAAFVVHVYFIS